MFTILNSMMNQSQHAIEVSIEIVSETLTLQDLELSLLTAGDRGSRSRGDALPRGRRASVTLLRVDAPSFEIALEDQFAALRQLLPPTRVSAVTEPLEVTFCVVVYSAAASITTTLPSPAVLVIADYRASLRLIVYAISDNSEVCS